MNLIGYHTKSYQQLEFDYDIRQIHHKKGRKETKGIFSVNKNVSFFIAPLPFINYVRKSYNPWEKLKFLNKNILEKLPIAPILFHTYEMSPNLIGLGSNPLKVDLN